MLSPSVEMTIQRDPHSAIDFFVAGLHMRLPRVHAGRPNAGRLQRVSGRYATGKGVPSPIQVFGCRRQLWRRSCGGWKRGNTYGGWTGGIPRALPEVGYCLAASR